MGKLKNITLRKMDGTEKRCWRLARQIARPKDPNFFGDNEDGIEECAWEFGVEDCILPGLKDEIYDLLHGNRNPEVTYLYGCPYCGFKSQFFHGVDLHIAYSRNCFRRSQGQPCYPINHCKDRKGRQVLT